METCTSAEQKGQSQKPVRKELLSERDGNKFTQPLSATIRVLTVRKELLSERDGNLLIFSPSAFLRISCQEGTSL